MRQTPLAASHELPAGHFWPLLQSRRHLQLDARRSFFVPTGHEPSGLQSTGSVIVVSSHFVLLQNFVPSLRWHSYLPRALQSGGGVRQRAVAEHLGQSLQSSVLEHWLPSLHTPMDGPPSVEDVGQGLSQKRVPSDFWQENKLREAQSGAGVDGLHRGALVQSVSQSLQSSVGSQDFFSVHTVVMGGLQIFSARSQRSGGLHWLSLSQAGWHLPSALHLEPPGHSPFGPQAISVQEAVQIVPDAPF